MKNRMGIAAVLVASFGWCQAPSPSYFVQFSPTIFGMQLPAAGGNPESHCWAWVRLGGLYDSEVACYVGGAFTGVLATAAAGAGFDGGFRAPGGGFIRWAFLPGSYHLGAQLGDGTPAQLHDGYY